jgi:hypothetical protein
MPILILFALAWSSVCIAINCSIWHDYYKQFQSRNFPSVTGTITQSKLESHTTKKGQTYYEAVINYQYKVGDQTFHGDKLVFGEYESAHLPNDATTINSHPVGSEVQVYYNPGNPNEALLYPGINDPDLAPVLFLTPFNMVMIGFWVFIGAWLRLVLFKPIAGGVKIITDGMTTRARLPRYSAFWWALGTVGGLGFIFTFVIGMIDRLRSSSTLALGAAFTVYLAGLVVYIWQLARNRSGVNDLIIDEATRKLELPLTFGRKERVAVRFSDIELLWVETIVRSGPRGSSTTYAPTLNLRGDKLGRQKLAEWSDILRANEFTGWLATKIGVRCKRTSD